MNFEQLVHPFIKELTNPPQEKLIKEGSVNKDAIREALKLGFPDITPRTMSRDKNYKKAGKLEFKDLPDALFAYPSVVPQKTFGDLIVDWFDHDHVNWREEYETFHAAACQTVQIFLRDQLYTEESCTYGKAQKVVNMTFKHIYCLSEGKKREWFLECHMALDFFTLEWFKRNIAEHGAKYTLGKVDNWSALQNPIATEYIGKENKVYYSYHYLVQLIRMYFESQKPFGELCPLEAEFIIWPEIQLRLCAEDLIYQLAPTKYSRNTKNAKDEKQKIQNLSVKDLLTEVEKTIYEYPIP
jgi:hypothetical protein